jgi:hypothetical protein
MQEQVMKLETIRECLSDSIRDQELVLTGLGEELNISSGDDGNLSGGP